MRQLTATDRLLGHIDLALRTSFGTAQGDRPSPAGAVEDGPMDAADRRHAAGLMRINHAGEVCAQALYSGQAATARDPAITEHMAEAAREETDHLAWCEARLAELGSRPSHFNPLWYGGSFLIGAFAGIAGDRWSLGFVTETERQVEAHLEGHLETLPEGDRRSRAVVRQMAEDEARHAEQALDAGGSELPEAIRRAMGRTAAIMKWTAYRW